MSEILTFYWYGSFVHSYTVLPADMTPPTVGRFTALCRLHQLCASVRRLCIVSLLMVFTANDIMPDLGLNLCHQGQLTFWQVNHVTACLLGYLLDVHGHYLAVLILITEN